MIKRYIKVPIYSTPKSTTTNPPGISHYEWHEHPEGDMFRPDDVKALETENTELRERVVELLKCLGYPDDHEYLIEKYLSSLTENKS